MNNPKLTVAHTLSKLVVTLAAIQAVGGFFLPNLYRDIPLIQAGMKGTDLVTMLLVTPLLAWALFAAQRGSQKAQLLWMGCLAYMAYNYLYYLFGIAFNRFFLLYVAAFVCSFYALIYGLSGIDIKSISLNFKEKMPKRWIAGFLGFIGGMLFVVETSQVLQFLWSGTLPAAIAQFGDLDAPAMIYAADLALVIPAFALAAVWLWNARPWGYLMAAIMLVKSFTYGLALISMSLFVWWVVGVWDPLMPFYIFIATGGFIFLWIYLKNLE